MNYSISLLHRFENCTITFTQVPLLNSHFSICESYFIISLIFAFTTYTNLADVGNVIDSGNRSLKTYVSDCSLVFYN